jgi:hypothetical protein
MMHKKILISIYMVFLLTNITSFVKATTYYVDATNGNDNNDGLSESNAWKTIGKVNSESFQPGHPDARVNGGYWSLECGDRMLDW